MAGTIQLSTVQIYSIFELFTHLHAAPAGRFYFIEIFEIVETVVFGEFTEFT